jgi:hypothetical protein
MMTKLSAFAQTLSIVALVIGAGTARVHAAIYTLNLSGNVNNATTSSFVSNGSVTERHDQWYLQLGGMPSILVHKGDVIDATITLDQSCTIAASASSTRLFFGLTLYGYPGYPDLVVGSDTTASFFNQGIAGFVTPTPTTVGTTSQVPCNVGIYPPNNLSLTFDKVTLHTTVTFVSFLFTVDSARLSYDVATPVPVPEPGALALCCMGLGMAGLLVSRRRKNQTRDN